MGSILVDQLHLPVRADVSGSRGRQRKQSHWQGMALLLSSLLWVAIASVMLTVA